MDHERLDAFIRKWRAAMDVAATPVTAASKGKKPAWPGTMAEQVQAVRNILAASTTPLTPDDAAKHYARASRARVAEILETLAAWARPGRWRTEGISGGREEGGCVLTCATDKKQIPMGD